MEQTKEQLSRHTDHKLPTLWINPEVKSIFDLTPSDIKLIDYKRESSIKAPIAV